MGDLRRAVALLALPRWPLVRALLLGSLALASAVGLAAASAWLIARASQMPPVLHLTVAVVSVRALGISRGVLRYLERLAGHDVALRGVVNLRTTVYERLAGGRTEVLASVRRGDLLARTGVDVDDVGDVVVRALLPAGVAVIVSAGSVVLVACFSPAAAAVLAVCLAVNGLAVPALAARRDAATEAARVGARARIAAAASRLVDDAAELAVDGRRGDVVTALRSAEADLAAAQRESARPVAAAAAVSALSTGVAVLGALVVGITAHVAGGLAATELAVVVLVPLAAFEATNALPAAATQLRRSSAAAARIMALLDAAGPAPADAATGGTTGAGRITARGLSWGWPGGPALGSGLDLDVDPGRSVAIVGPSGVGKTTLLLTLAGLLPPRAGTVRIDDVDPYLLRGPARSARVAFTAEDAHVFATSVLENLRVARGDVQPAEARAALDRAGIGAWVGALPGGLEEDLGEDGAAVSGGERRRLLLARALLAPAPVLLLDEPAEHLEPERADALVTDLLAASDDRTVVLVTHRREPLGAADAVLELSDHDERGERADEAGRREE
ncbi:ABC transporter, CydDC cysteine exporter (CydDC-E) family, permease/ATP-binding protein CydC [Beutenbergia cavernae DSM 12333]|uniref:ABC transporter, CydDC cysteine exporter (CydDC-E) family, permease/ATP-binding protein CydC n=1 Tax=Beutenbergia cavernae (strain ATCC BAA-8 / DSM 12333 / CCUG 43141 / JCM 11478 / NBRC 16432 / NCIMB 13614 / HKI 0122) TaxID=471853 RepID=C5C3H1_BEUC1|nr:thiol reductant ABC exporter subunit CydC [Beutenbergia cavernae]ACQ79870.1 ABC transporter, CydDC cysteine exporter (CydDC-E) family, permease/ATP-binding protein CydC [Beutenbergia cavernae DSM 12333]